MTPIEIAATDYGPEHLITQIAHWLTDVKGRMGERCFSDASVIARFATHPEADIRWALLYLASNRVQLLELFFTQEVDGQERVLSVQEARRAIVEEPDVTCVSFRFRAP